MWASACFGAAGALDICSVGWHFGDIHKQAVEMDNGWLVFPKCPVLVAGMRPSAHSWIYPQLAWLDPSSASANVTERRSAMGVFALNNKSSLFGTYYSPVLFDAIPSPCWILLSSCIASRPTIRPQARQGALMLRGPERLWCCVAPGLPGIFQGPGQPIRSLLQRRPRASTLCRHFDCFLAAVGILCGIWQMVHGCEPLDEAGLLLHS